MRVDAGTSGRYTSPCVQPAAVADTGASSFSAALMTTATDAIKAGASGVKQADFTSMTRQGMRDWVNEQIRNGEMSLDDSQPFMAMTMHIPISAVAYGGEVSAVGDFELIDFTQKVRDGIEGALSRNDQVTLEMLQSAMQIMQRHHGQSIGVDVHA